MRARRTDPMTSHRAGAECSEWIEEHHRKIIVAFVKAGRPMTYIDIATHAMMDAQQVARRLMEIEIKGVIKRLGPITMKYEGKQRASTYTLWSLTESAKREILALNA
jgi:hypothetical protein